MASEDHDFEEIKSFQTKNKKFEISCNDKNICTGRIKPKGLNKIISELEFYFQNKPFKDEIISLFKKAYNKDLNLSESTKSYSTCLIHVPTNPPLSGWLRETSTASQ